jgi:ABC-type transport system involved in cytochrome bd biosynthesis fused ATPase/permease subunit
MIINKRLIAMSGKSVRYIILNVIFQWIGLLVNMAMIFSITRLIGKLQKNVFQNGDIAATAFIITAGILLRFATSILASQMSFKASGNVKKTIRDKIYQKLLSLGISYNRHISTAEAVQLSSEGTEQLEIYFGKYLPQFFYSLLAPLTLFAVLSHVNIKSAVVLLVCVPLIPMSIIMIQKFAKKLLAKYWGEYLKLGDNFLENVQGLTTLKIYQADDHKNREMNLQAERFRKITMKVLTMQLNSVTLMDLVAYAGTAVGILVSLLELLAGHLDVAGCLAIIMLASDFFIPLRLLGSYFHIAMNGMAAGDKMFALLDISEEVEKTETIDDTEIRFENVSFSYDKTRKILKNITLANPKGSFTALVGESGSGKSTIAALLAGGIDGYSGSIKVGGKEISAIAESSVMKQCTLIGYKSHLFKGTVRENLLMGNPAAPEELLISTLEQIRLWDFLQAENGLDTRLSENASNLSGGQRQRLAIARALLHDSNIYIFDEATSNIDVESENDIMALVHKIAKTKTVILISHRLLNAKDADRIYVIKDGKITEDGTHGELLSRNGTYAALWDEQQNLEHYRGEIA